MNELNECVSGGREGGREGGKKGVSEWRGSGR